MSKTRSFFRAINLEFDVQVPERLSHYQPTSRSLPVVEAVLGRDPTLVIAAYGSGKSLAAGVGALLTVNDARARHVVSQILPKVRQVDAEVQQRLVKRFSARQPGRAIVLCGHVGDPVREIRGKLGAPAKLTNLEQVLAWAGANLSTHRHIAIIWDEFGRHLESLVAEGRSRELDVVQRLAEWAARSQAPTVSLTLLSHQNLLAYAGGLNQTSRNEWRKIEGRFRTLRFVEDSRELYRMLAVRIHERRGGRASGLDSKLKDAIAGRAVAVGWFDGATDVGEVAALLDQAWPISAGALQVLPRLVTRIGQNERSLFSLVEEVDLSHPVGCEGIYRAFSDAMRCDVGAGGAHRRWVETESALAKAESNLERETLAAACLLQLGTDGERRRLSRAALETAVASRGASFEEVERAFEALVLRKLLLHRRVVDDVSVWHGVDVDVASRLAEERARRADAFDLITFLSERRPVPVIHATRHNVEFGTTRYLSGRYVLPDDLVGDTPMTGVPFGPWGDVLYVIAETDAEIARTRKAAMESGLERTLFAVPSRPLRIRDAALEVASLEALRTDDTLLGQDPLVAVEIDELLSVARRHLDLAVHRLTSDRPTDAKWFHAGSELPIRGERPATIVVSELMREWYPKTPRIANDQLMRQRVSRQMSTARIRLLSRVAEAGSKAWMRYGPEDTSVEASVYRTVLAKTGLHRERDGVWGFAEPDEIRDPGLRRAWKAIKVFFQAPAEEPKKLSGLVSKLSRPPIGAPAGIVPVIVMAGYRAFARCVSLRSDGIYVADILGFDASRMFEEPARHTVEVHPADERTLRYLDGLALTFAHVRNDEGVETLRFAYDAFLQWRAGLPDGVRRSRHLPDSTRTLLRVVSDASDPATFFFRTLPDLFGGTRSNYGSVIEALESRRDEIDGLLEGHLDDAVRVLGETFRIGDSRPMEAVRSWVDCLDVDALLGRDDLRLTDKAVLRTVRDTATGRFTTAGLARAVSSILLQRGVEQWQDGTAGQFSMMLRECRARIEDAALADGAPSARLAPVIRERIAELQALLARVDASAVSGSKEPAPVNKNIEPGRPTAGGQR